MSLYLSIRYNNAENKCKSSVIMIEISIKVN
jgi:hypothetical protein